MKRVAVCVVAGVLLAMSTAAFATPVTVNLPMPDASSNINVTSGITNSTTNPGANGTITWFQQYSFTPVLPDLSPYPAGGTLTGPDVDITSAVMTIVANGVWQFGSSGAQIDRVDIRKTSSDPWTTLGNLNTSPLSSGQSTTVFTLDSTVRAMLEGSTGFNVQVVLTQFPTNQGDTVSSSRLNATTAYSYNYTYESEPEPVIPAPGAILLASMGAGLVSWMRARKVL